jgi:FAD/FMN-containing dehydrogenase
MDTFETELRQILGESGVLAPRDFHQRAAGIWRQSESLSGIALARPRNTQETAACLALCYQREIPVVTQGGLTGLVRGADTLSSGLVLSLERMNTIE